VRILLRDRSGATVTETKHFILDGQTPVIQPELPASGRAGEVIRIQARTDADVVLLTARIGDAPPIPLRWDAEARCSVGLLRIPERLAGSQEVLFEAVDWRCARETCLPNKPFFHPLHPLHPLHPC
jgi:hypothetical protein